jgi:hypothetical protein
MRSLASFADVITFDPALAGQTIVLNSQKHTTFCGPVESQ